METENKTNFSNIEELYPILSFEEYLKETSHTYSYASYVEYQKCKREGYLAAKQNIYSNVRNKLTPIKNLIAMLENGLAKGDIEVHNLVLEEIKNCKSCINNLINT